MDLQERLDGYEVTAVPPREVALTLVWCDAPGLGAAEDEADDADEVAEVDADPVLTILDDYRITRIPGRAAS